MTRTPKDHRFMLGNERKLYEVDGVRYCHVTQVGKIEEVWEEFGKHCEQVRKLDRARIRSPPIACEAAPGRARIWVRRGPGNQRSGGPKSTRKPGAREVETRKPGRWFP